MEIGLIKVGFYSFYCWRVLIWGLNWLWELNEKLRKMDYFNVFDRELGVG